jgi:hypothetical protein
MAWYNRAKLIWVAMLILSSCSLLKVEVATDVEPLDEHTLNARILTHNYLKTYLSEIMNASDSIMDIEKDRDIRIRALLWKINATQLGREKVLQSDPEMAIIDTWALAGRMYDFFNEGPGDTLFGHSQPIAVQSSDILLAKIDTIGRIYFGKDYNNAYQFVNGIRKAEPFVNFETEYSSVFAAWNKHKQIPDSLIQPVIGSLPQVMSDMNTRVGINTEQSILQARWNGQLLVLENELDSIDIQGISNSVDEKIMIIVSALESAESALRESMNQLHKDVQSIVYSFNTNVDSLSRLAERELSLFRDSLGVEREALMKDMDATTENRTRVAMEELRKTIKSILLYVIILLAVILFIPFTLGYFTGRASKNLRIRRSSKKE